MKTFLTLLRKYFFQTFSIGAVLIFLLSNVFQPSFWSIKIANASALTYGNGVYTNLHGSGTAADSHTGDFCDPSSGSCTGSGYKYTCSGSTTDCRSSEEAWSGSASLGNPGCGKTVQLDVFNQSCRDSNGNWTCGLPVDYMVWYSGDCAAPPPPGPVCSYGSTQARWQKNTSDPWGQSKTINMGESARVGGFHDGTGQFAGDITLTITGPGNSTTLGNGGTFTPTQAGNYQLKVTTNNQSGAACEDTATLTVNGTTPPPPPPATCAYSSTQARVQRNLQDPWDSSKTINTGDQIRVGGFHDGTGQFANDVNLNVTGPANFSSLGNGAFITPAVAGSYNLTVTTQNGSGAACTDAATFTVVGPSSTPTPVPTPTPNPTPVPGCTSNGSCSVGMPSACGQTNTGVDNCNRACSRSSALCAVGGPNITNNNTNNNTNTNSQSQNVNVGIGRGTQVLGAKELPKTGLPELAWSALAFVPAGFGLRKFRSLKKDLTNNPNFIWEDRQFKS